MKWFIKTKLLKKNQSELNKCIVFILSLYVEQHKSKNFIFVKDMRVSYISLYILMLKFGLLE